MKSPWVIAAASILGAFWIVNGGGNLLAAPGTTTAPAAPSVSVAPESPEMENKDQQDEATMLVDSLLDDLSGDDEAAQKKAHNQLVGMGDAAIPEIERWLQGNHLAATRKRVQAVLEELETKFKFDPTLITLHMTNEAPKKVFEELGKQSGITFEGRYVWDQRFGGNNIPRKISVDMDKKPFWEALIEICQKTHVWAQNNGNSTHVLHLYQGSNGDLSGPRFNAGPVLFVGNTISRTIQLGADGKNSKSLTLQVRGYMDPKLKVYDASYEIQVTEAAGDQGGSFVPKNQQNNSTTSGNGMQLWNQAPLAYDTGKNTKLTSFKGMLRLRIAGQIDKIEVPDVMNAKGKSVTGKKWTLEIKNIKEQGKNSKSYEVNILGTAPKDPSAGRRGYNWSEMGSFRLFDADGKEYDYRGGGGSYNPDRVEQQIYFGKDDSSEKIGPPAKFVWEANNSSRNIRVPVEFKDIPIPLPE